MMTRDEAWRDHIGWRSGAKRPWDTSHRRHCFDAGYEAGGQLDTITMLERLAERGDDPIWKGIQVNYCPVTKAFTYFRPVDNPVNITDLSREEVEQLLV